MQKRNVVLLICDGLGFREEREHNAVAQAHTPHFDRYWQTYPHALLKASGEHIGLPDAQMGTSESNHLVIGSGRIIYQNLVKINAAVRNGELSGLPAIAGAFEHVKRHGSTLHIKGIASPGGVHGHVDHIKALVQAAKEQGISEVLLHLFTDGRDTPPQSAKEYIDDLQRFLAATGVGRIASVGGRYWGMDRDTNHDRVEKHFQAIALGNAPLFTDVMEAIDHAYQQKITDEFIEPAVIAPAGATHRIKENDAVIFSNFRSDRAKQLARRFIDTDIPNLYYAGFTQYADEFSFPVAFGPESITNTLSEVVSKGGLRQLRVTETEKFAHLTFFFNAQRYEADPGEERIMFESNKDVATHDQKPEMKVAEIADAICDAIAAGNHDLICSNLVNCDMVGHSGNFPAIIAAVEAVDAALGKIVSMAAQHATDVIITADHGNAEETFDTIVNQPLTSHTLNDVPFILISSSVSSLKRSDGNLADIAPTILQLLDLPQPPEMTGRSLV